MDFLELLVGSGGEVAVGYGISFVLGLVGCPIVYWLFSRSTRRPQYLHSPRILLLHDFLNFRVMWTSWFNKVLYLFSALALNLCALVTLFGMSFLMGLLMLIFGNIFLRCMYELTQVIFSIHANLNSLADKALGREKDASEASAEQVFGGLGRDIRAKQREMRERAEARREQEEAQYRRMREAEERRAREEGAYGRGEAQGYEAAQTPHYSQPSPSQQPPVSAQQPPAVQVQQPPVGQVQQPPAPASSAPAFCSKCGNPLDGVGAFCSKCGAAI